MQGEPTFIWEVSNATNGKTKPNVVEAVFGNGYRGRVKDGFKALGRTMNIDIGPIESPLAVTIHDFLDAQSGMPFWWKPIKPFPQIEVRWTCDDYGFKRGGGLITGITAVFIKFNTPGVP